MTQDLARYEASQVDPALIERIVTTGDLAKLDSRDRVAYYSATCRSLGLNPLTRPFQFLALSGKLILYATKDATDQLRKLHRVSIAIVARERIEDVYVVTAQAVTPDGRRDESTGAVNLAGLKGDALANAMMRGETKAKRRATLSIIGLGWLDESEVEGLSGARRVDPDTGEVMEARPQLEAPRRSTPPPVPPVPDTEPAPPVSPEEADDERRRLGNRLDLCETLTAVDALWQEQSPESKRLHRQLFTGRKTTLEAQAAATVG